MDFQYYNMQKMSTSESIYSMLSDKAHFSICYNSIFCSIYTRAGPKVMYFS
jgi:hypothetical protein